MHRSDGRGLAGKLLAFWKRSFGRTGDISSHTARPLRILVIDDIAPDLLNGAGSPRALALLNALSRTGAAVVQFPTLLRPDGSAAPPLRIPNVSFVTGDSGSLASLGPYLRRHHRRFDAIIVSRRHNLIAFNAALSQRPGIAASKFIIFDSEAIFATREELHRRVMARPFKAADFTVEEEVALARTAQMVIAVNEIDAVPFRDAGYRDVRVLGHAVDPVLGAQRYAERSKFLFVGPTFSDDTPNSDSVNWFVDLVLPGIRSVLGPHVVLTHVGKSMAPRVLARRGSEIEMRGPQHDIAAEFGSARVFVAPTRFASGIPLKVCEAAAHGVPCVITPVLARQLGWQHEREALVAESPEDFARQCVRLFEDSALWERIRAAAYARIIDDCDRTRFNQVVADICSYIKSWRGTAFPEAGAAAP
jgi:glycosyltransferase involved in cell wall biosynthesis